ncbi:MAG: hypothetical protein AB7W37_00635 [Syntrophobacteraceae bacterium]|jgi:stalled ribosome alternative rescue factor ArfA
MKKKTIKDVGIENVRRLLPQNLKTKTFKPGKGKGSYVRDKKIPDWRGQSGIFVERGGMRGSLARAA